MAVTGVLAVIYGLKEIAQGDPSPLSLGSALAGLVVGALWVRRQRHLADPMIDVALFRNRSFNAALAINFLSIFVMVGYFLFVAQYLQLVVGLSPFEAGLWSLPGAIGFVVASQLAPRIVPLMRPAYLIGGGLFIAAMGLVVLTRVDTSGDLLPIVAGSIIISLGLAPVFGLTTELIVGSAPPERAGAASGISETGAELGGALGIAILGSVGVAIYRGEVTDQLPVGVPDAAAAAARDTLGSAVAVAQQLPDQLGAAVVATARDAFVHGMQLTTSVAAIIAVGLAIMAVVALRGHRMPTDGESGGDQPPAESPLLPEQLAHSAPTQFEGAC
jgi:DHA2 family multidrug resistance protein-like MFS transporter